MRRWRRRRRMINIYSTTRSRIVRTRPSTMLLAENLICISIADTLVSYRLQGVREQI